MLFGTMREGSETKVKLSSVSANCARGIIEWAYTGGLTNLFARLSVPCEPAPAAPAFSFGNLFLVRPLFAACSGCV